MTNQNIDLNNLVEGWNFRFVEISPNYYRIEGNNISGHSVSRTCSELDLNVTLDACIKDVRDIQKQIDENN